MNPIPSDVAERFSIILKTRKVPASLHGEYRKWLRYYLDFREKYPPPPARSEQVRLFVNKLREKKQPPEFPEQAAHDRVSFASRLNRKSYLRRTSRVASGRAKKGSRWRRSG